MHGVEGWQKDEFWCGRGQLQFSDNEACLYYRLSDETLSTAKFKVEKCNCLLSGSPVAWGRGYRDSKLRHVHRSH